MCCRVLPLCAAVLLLLIQAVEANDEITVELPGGASVADRPQGHLRPDHYLGPVQV